MHTERLLDEILHCIEDHYDEEEGGSRVTNEQISEWLASRALPCESPTVAKYLKELGAKKVLRVDRLQRNRSKRIFRIPGFSPHD
jgi:hypothetical protein